jgi:lipoyl(octanoyl) transferase
MIEWKHEKDFVEYRLAEETMSQRVDEIIKNRKTELVWFLEHKNIYTLGTSAKISDFKHDTSLPVYQTKRGGQTTYHGPGQRIVYIMLDLRNGRKDIKKLIWNVEEWLILVLEDLGLSGYRIPGLIGVWVKDPAKINIDGTHDKKIAALGLRVKKWVTFHGLSLNVHPNLDFFSNINPCGISEKGVTSLQELGIKVEMAEIDELFKINFPKIFTK